MREGARKTILHPRKSVHAYITFVEPCLLYIPVYHKWRSNDIWFLKYKVRQTYIFVILGHFFSFRPLDNLENQNFNIEKNTSRYYHFTHLHHKWQSYDVWFLGYGAQQTYNFLSFWTIFCTYTPYGPITSKFWKNEKIPEDIIILQMYTIDDSYMMYGSWDMECKSQNFLSFWTVFLPFYPLTTWKIKILKNWKKHLGILSFPTSVQIFCHFGPFFALLLP